MNNSRMVKKVHLGLLVLLLANLLLFVISDLEFDNRLMFLVRVLIYATGVLLFINTFKNRSAITYYSPLYILSPIVVFFSWLSDGILGALLGSIFFAFLTPADNIMQSDRYQIRSQYTGFLSGCCSYNLYETKFPMFEKKIGEFRVQRTSNEIADLRINGDQAVVYYKVEPAD
ncbi:hypothetical protein [Pontibacter indicus]|nr:hypothetical protein [Pontibacter indicus]